MKQRFLDNGEFCVEEKSKPESIGVGKCVPCCLSACLLGSIPLSVAQSSLRVTWAISSVCRARSHLPSEKFLLGKCYVFPMTQRREAQANSSFF